MEKYQNLTLEKLIIYSVAKVTESSEECTFERLVKECFEKFPKSFGFYRYSQWPDSLKLDRSLRKLRKEGHITGSNETRFVLTKSGESYANAVAKELGSRILHKKPSTGGRKEEKILKRIKNSSEFQEYRMRGNKILISESQVRSLAYSTLETPLEVVIGNLDKIGELANQTGETELGKFVRYCKKLLHHD